MSIARQNEPYTLRLVRVVGDNFVAGFETDGKIRRAAPILKSLLNKTDAEARAIIAQNGWRAAIVTHQPTPPTIKQNTESMEVLKNGARAFFYFDDNAGRRAISGRVDKQTALTRAQAYLKAEAC